MLTLDFQRGERLPSAVYDLALRLGVKPRGDCSRVRLTFVGEVG